MQYKNEFDQKFEATKIESQEQFAALEGKQIVILHRRQGAMPGAVRNGKFQAIGNPIPAPSGERFLIPESCLGYVQLDKENLRTGYDVYSHEFLGYVAVVP